MPTWWLLADLVDFIGGRLGTAGVTTHCMRTVSPSDIAWRLARMLVEVCAGL
jgi:hypothetical protein